MTLLDVKIAKAGYEQANEKIRDIHFTINPGTLVGMIGPNGAGKSTTIKSILGVLECFEGHIEKRDPFKYAYIPERPVFYDNLTLFEHLDLLATMMEIPEQDFQVKSEYLLRQFHMNTVIHELPSSFSKGMQQKLMLIQALLIEPDLYIIDEPFIGLDPKAIKTFLRFMELEKQRGAGILMCTHVLDTAEKICDRFLLLAKGSLVAQGTLEEVRGQCGLEDGSLIDCFDILVEDSI